MFKVHVKKYYNFLWKFILHLIFRNLHILMLSENQLSVLPSSLFSPLSSLNSLSLDHNLLASLPEDLFSASSNLGVLALNSNLLEAIPLALGSLINLRTLDIGENMIKQVIPS